MKLIPRPVHAVLDYLYGAAALAAPKVLGFEDEANAKLICTIHGATTIAASLLTDYELGLVKKIPFNTHLKLDLGGALLGLAAPWLLGFSHNTKARNAVVGFALLEIAVVALSEPDAEVFQEFKD